MNMREKIANDIGKYISSQLNYPEEKVKVIVYGLWNILTLILLLGDLLLIKVFIVVLLKIDIPIFTTYLGFSVLRVYLGGFHLNNTSACFISTLVLTLICSLIAYYIGINLNMLSIMYIVGYIVIFMIGVIDNKNKRYNEKRKVRYKKYSLMLLTGLLIINIVIYQLGFKVISNALVIGMLMEISNLVIGRCVQK
jgi:accessory gene regulator B